MARNKTKIHFIKLWQSYPIPSTEPYFNYKDWFTNDGVAPRWDSFNWRNDEDGCGSLMEVEEDECSWERLGQLSRKRIGNPNFKRPR